jgi:hypothetical protein
MMMVTGQQLLVVVREDAGLLSQMQLEPYSKEH